MASARKFSPCYSRDDLTLGPVLGEISSHPFSSSSSLTSAAGAEMTVVFQLLQRNIDPERTILNLNQVSTKRGLYQDSYPCGCLPNCCPACTPGPAQQRVHCPCQRNIDPERTIINLNQVSNKRGFYQDSYLCGCLPNCCPACRPGPAQQRVHCPRHGAALPLRTFLLSTSDWYGGQPWHTVER